jgi:uncharacterized protein (TIGR02678 family)
MTDSSEHRSPPQLEEHAKSRRGGSPSRVIAAHQRRQDLEERTEAVRALLMTPLMTPANPGFTIVRQHSSFLKEWFARETGWVLHVERNCARLFKRPADLSDDTRGIPDFGRDRYVLFCLVCAVLERAQSQITLRDLGKRLLDLAAEPALAERNFHFAMDRQEQRRSLVVVCRTLVEIGILQRVAGDEEGFVINPSGAEGEFHDALYDVNRRVLAGILVAARGPSTWASEEAPIILEHRLHSLVAEYVPDSEEGRLTARRHHLSRRLLDDPVVYLKSLADPDLQRYYVNQRGPMAVRLAEMAGLVPEQRSEGLALADKLPGNLTDVAIPGNGTEDHITLLVAEHLAATFEGQEDPAPVEIESIAEFIRDCRGEFGRYWKKSAKVLGSELELASVAVAGLRKLKLITVSESRVRPLPALARIAVEYPEIRQKNASTGPLSEPL